MDEDKKVFTRTMCERLTTHIIPLYIETIEIDIKAMEDVENTERLREQFVRQIAEAREISAALDDLEETLP